MKKNSFGISIRLVLIVCLLFSVGAAAGKPAGPVQAQPPIISDEDPPIPPYLKDSDPSRPNYEKYLPSRSLEPNRDGRAMSLRSYDMEQYRSEWLQQSLDAGGKRLETQQTESGWEQKAIEQMEAEKSAFLEEMRSSLMVSAETAVPAAEFPTAVFDCNDVSEIPLEECQALVDFYTSTNGASWTNNSGWLSSNTPCSWYGLGCSAGHIVSMVIGDNNLVGPIPNSIANLTQLGEIRLSNNGLTGDIPVVFENLTNLWWLELRNNQLTGEIPSGYGNLSNLYSLSINGNQISGSIPSSLGNYPHMMWLNLDSNNLSGSIPPELGNLDTTEWMTLNDNSLSGTIPSNLGALSNIQGLTLHDNELSGEIPVELGNLTTIEILYLGSNQLTGTLPSQLGNLVNMKEFWAFNNYLSGEIPAAFGNLSSLKTLALWSNQLSGPIPSTLGNLTALESLELQGNQLTGTIPAELEGLPNLRCLQLGWNQLGGSIPAWIGNVSNLDVLELHGNQFTGSIPSSLGNLAQLQNLNLSYNQLSGAIPTEIGNLTNLELLVLSHNQLSGNIPAEIWNLIQLQELWLSYNELTGIIPPEMGNLINLYMLTLGGNQLTGSIPTQIGNLSNLAQLHLWGNQLSGSIPSAMGNLTNLDTMNIRNNQLSGNIPPELGNLSNLEWLALDNNALTGSLPSTLGNLTILKGFYAQVNSLSGEIPASIGNLSELRYLVLYLNELSGPMPTTLGNLVNLEMLDLGDNQLTGSIPAELGNLTQLKGIYIGTNQLSGTLPPELGNLTQLEEFWGFWNAFSGEIPPSFGNLSSLKTLALWSNQLSGPIPSTLGNLTALESLELQGNQLTGTIPAELEGLPNLRCLQLGWNQLGGSIPALIGNLSNLDVLELQGNQLSGSIPAEIGNLTNLELLMLSHNQLSGNIPAEIWTLTQLQELWLSYNELTGTIPPEIGNLTNLYMLTLGGNQLTGSIPTQIGNLSNLAKLHLWGNQLSGSIPSEMGNLANLDTLVLFNNQLSGNIPLELGNLTSLKWLVLSENQLTGTLPVELGGISALEELFVGSNQIEGPIPATIGNLTELLTLDLSNNHFSGEIPASITNLVKLNTGYDGTYTDIGYNHLYSNDPIVIAFLNEKDPDWESTQTPLNQTRMGAWVDTIYFEADGGVDLVERLESGEIDLHVGPISDPATIQSVKNSSQLDYAETYGSYNELTFNPAGPIFTNGKLNPFSVPRVREAINWLIDRDHIADVVYGGAAVPRWLPINTVSHDSVLLAENVRKLELKYAYDVEEANQVISEEMAKLGAVKTGGKWHYNSSPVEISMLIRTEDERRAIGDYLSDQLEAAGFTVNRNYQAAADASPCWIQSEPIDGCFHIYTGGWITTAIPRDLAGNFNFFYTPRGLSSPLWQAYSPSPEFDQLALDLDNQNFSSQEVRSEMMSRALELALEDSVRLWLVDRSIIVARRAETAIAYDLYGGFSSQMWPYTIRYKDQVGGNLSIGTPSLFYDAWNPLNGSNWIYDKYVAQATSDRAMITDPYTGLVHAQRIEQAQVTVQSDLPVRKTLDWITLSYANEIQVPGDAWVDWDAGTQTFITAAEKYPGGTNALRKSVVQYPSDLYSTVKWHDGSNLSPADFVMAMILQFDRANSESAVYDESLEPGFWGFMDSFRGVKILSTDPLIIETYSDLWRMDAELMVEAWWPTYDTGPGAWHNLALGLLAEENQEAAFTISKADQLDIYKLDYLTGPSLSILENQLIWASNQDYFPYAPTLDAYISTADADARWTNIQQWYANKGHFWIGTGPFYLNAVDAVETSITLQRNIHFPDPTGKWDDFSTSPIVEMEIEGPEVVNIGSQAVFELTLTAGGIPYLNQDLEKVHYFILDASGQDILDGSALPVEDGHWQLILSQAETLQLIAGATRLEVLATSQRVSKPSFVTKHFLTTATIQPANGSTALSRRPQFQWPAVTDATAYQVQIATASNFSTLLMSLTSPTNTVIPTADLPLNKTIYWRVRAKVDGINQPWSIRYSFTSANPPSNPTLVSPANNALTTNYTPKLTWSQSTLPAGTIFDHYLLQIATDASFNPAFVVLEQTITDRTKPTYTLTPGLLQPNTQYFWRVRAAITLGHLSNWSAARSLRAAMLPPNLSAPVEASTAFTPRPEFSWTAVDGASSYTIQISLYSNFSTLFLTANQTGLTFTPTKNLTQNKTIHWRVRANGANGPSLWAKGSFTSANPPSTPSLVSPANNALNTNYVPLLKWGASTLPTGTTFRHYRLQVASDNAFKDLAFEKLIDIRTTPFYQVLVDDALQPNTKYFWRVQAENTLDQTSTWSAVRSFRSAMLPTTLTAPMEASTALTRRPDFAWTAVDGATSYTIQLSLSATFGTLITSATPTGPAYTATISLPQNKTIHWRVRANGANGPSLWAKGSFTSANPPSTPSLVSPASNALNTNYVPLLKWGASTLPTGTTFRHYRLQVATDNGFNDLAFEKLIDNRTTPFYQVVLGDALESNTKYFWRMQAENTLDQFSTWSAVRSFRSAMLPPVLTTPEDGSTITSRRPEFTWGPVDGATSYTIQLSFSATFGTLITSSTPASNSWTPSTNLSLNRTIHWRVRSNGSNGPSLWSKASFQITDSPTVSSSWRQVSSPTSVKLHAIDMVSASDVWAVGAGGTILHYDGSAWTTTSSPTTSDLKGIDLWDASTGWAVGTGGNIIRWNGTSWSSVSSPTTTNLNDVKILAANDAWAVGDEGTLLHWNGSAWATVTNPTTYDLYAVDFVTPSDGWAVGGGWDAGLGKSVYLRWNGSAWTSFTPLQGFDPLYDVEMVSATYGIAVGINNVKSFWNGTSWVDSYTQPMLHYHGLHLLSSTDGWAVGWEVSGKNIQRWNGTSWIQVACPTTDRLYDVQMQDSNLGWAVGDNGTILRYGP
jgi:peptide/nickel transport system substrate-binding protein